MIESQCGSIRRSVLNRADEARDILWLQNKVEPLLNQPFSFYGSYFHVS